MASYEKRGKSIRAVVSVMDHGTRHKVSKTFSGKRPKKEAEDWALHMEVDKADNQKIIASNMLFYEYFEQWYKQYKTGNIRKTSLMTYWVVLNEIKRIFKNIKLSDLSYLMLQERLDEFAESHSHNTMIMFVSKVKASLKDALFDGYITKDIYSRLKAHGNTVERDNVLSATEFETLQDYLYSHWKNSKINLAVLIALETGMRVGEVLYLENDEIFPEFNTIYIKRSYSEKDPDDDNTKNRQSVRKIKIPERLSKILKESFVDVKGRFFRMHLRDVEVGEQKLMESLGLKKISFHGLRHSHVSYLLYKGFSLEYVAKRVGHKNTSTTQRVYAHLLKEQEQKEDQKMMDLLSSPQMSPSQEQKPTK